MKTKHIGDYGIQWDGRTVWVHHEAETVARFGINGIDIHTKIEQQLAGESPCLSCTHSVTTHADWEQFVDEMLRYYNVQVPAAAIPVRFI